MSDREIVDRLLILACQEDLEVEEGVLSTIASRSNGSIHEAQILLDQFSLVNKRVTLASVQELVSIYTNSPVIFAFERRALFGLRQMFCFYKYLNCGIWDQMGLLPDRKLLNLLDYALSADTANTTQTMNEILGSSAEPLLLVSQLGILITNILVENFDEHQGTLSTKYFRASFGKRYCLAILPEYFKWNLLYNPCSTKSCSCRHRWYVVVFFMMGERLCQIFAVPVFSLSHRLCDVI